MGRVRVRPRISASILGSTLTRPLRGHPLPGRERDLTPNALAVRMGAMAGLANTQSAQVAVNLRMNFAKNSAYIENFSTRWRSYSQKSKKFSYEPCDIENHYRGFAKIAEARV
ncbi:hypothetical protein D3093_29190 (plasmid) [Azospirillum argentinense]|uniref:Uncharacterized protein n=1 Tax=Azospirillum argentinense TaxID=2970906 RepID=A0A4D8PMG0_9PROT|nr:hypothetical protein D3093_29190 [Azospirillum argentinense]